ncbi:MAG: AraC family transcriptional regulator [Lentisphaeria bacterium]|nr:AraC family transcriptional regulator [Lentisphaeria bacterium]
MTANDCYGKNVEWKGNSVSSIHESVIYRAALGRVGVPLGLRSVGHAVLPPGCRVGPRRTTFVHVIWTVCGSGQVNLDGVRHAVGHGQVLACPPAASHCLAAGGERSWEYRWCTLDGALSALLLAALPLPAGTFATGSCPEAIFLELAEKLRNPSPEGERQAGVAAYAFLSHLGGLASAQREFAGRGRAGMLLSRADAAGELDVNVKGLAESAGLSRSSVHRVFRQELGVTPKRYLDSLRMQAAMSLLRETVLSVEAVAAATGFANANYFAKFFRRKVGQSPSGFRSERHQL